MFHPSAHLLRFAARFGPGQLGDEGARLCRPTSAHFKRQDNQVISAVGSHQFLVDPRFFLLPFLTKKHENTVTESTDLAANIDFLTGAIAARKKCGSAAGLATSTLPSAWLPRVQKKVGKMTRRSHFASAGR